MELMPPINPYVSYGENYLRKLLTETAFIPHPIPAKVLPAKNMGRLFMVCRKHPVIIHVSLTIKQNLLPLGMIHLIKRQPKNDPI